MQIVREKCYTCNRPKSSCVCKYITKIKTDTKFVFLMHPKELKKTKNNTGKITHNSLCNSEIVVGIDFTDNEKINNIINNQDNECYLLYPSNDCIILNNENIKNKNKNIVIFIIDSTWACSKKILRVSSNINKLKKISFTHEKASAYKIKTQPNELSLSTIESTLCVLELLNKHKIEHLCNKDLSGFLNPFKQLVKYQLEFSDDTYKKQLRYKNRE